jgi:hypothetical protein
MPRIPPAYAPDGNRVGKPVAEKKNLLPRIFGRGGYAIVRHLGRLPDALPAIYWQLVN